MRHTSLLARFVVLMLLLVPLLAVAPQSSDATAPALNHGGVITTLGLGIDFPFGITASPDGALWFTNIDINSIGRITTSGS